MYALLLLLDILFFVIITISSVFFFISFSPSPRSCRVHGSSFAGVASLVLLGVLNLSFIPHYNALTSSRNTQIGITSP